MKPWQKVSIIILGTVFFIISLFFISLLQSPANFPVETMYTISSGMGLNKLASELKSKNIIKSPFIFKSFSVLFGGTKGIMAGDYLLKERETSFSLAQRMNKGNFQLELIKITLPEGLNIYEMAEIISSKLTRISKDVFIDKAKELEGYLFPDTYIFQTNTGVYTVIETLQKNYQDKIKTLADLIKTFGKSESDIIKMASIVEEEARTEETRRIIAGILWKRLALNMPLQVDASFKYINGKGTKDLTLDDLKIDSPYNSYLYKGLPPTPICNPGLDSIKATLTPIKTDYLYFLTDSGGNMHYAKTHQEHLLNKKLYLE